MHNRFEHLDLNPLDGDTETPTDGIRAAVAEFANVAGYNPYRIQLILETRGIRGVTVAQVRGAMAGL
jgi:hypothetical protein